MQTFAIRLAAAAAQCPFTGKALPALSESFALEAADRAAAYKLAKVKMSLRPMGQTLLTYIDGTQETGNW